MSNASNNDRFGGRFLIQDSNHMSDIPEVGGRFAIQDHDHLAGIPQVDQSQGSERQQGSEDSGKKSKKRPGRQYL